MPRKKPNKFVIHSDSDGPHTSDLREKLIDIGTDMFRRNGYVGTSVDDICRDAAATKGAFFHHFASKEKLGETCLVQWKSKMAAMVKSVPALASDDPVKRALGWMDFVIEAMHDPKRVQSCLAGTLVQEMWKTSPRIRDGVQDCFLGMQGFLKGLFNDAFAERKRKIIDTAGLARLWIANMQGALVLFKASGDPAIVPQNLRHVRNYIVGLLQQEQA